MFTSLVLFLKGLYLTQRHRLSDPDARRILEAGFRLRLSAEERKRLAPIATLRRTLEADHTLLEIQDYGAGTRASQLGKAVAKPRRRSVASVYRKAAIPPVWGGVLFRLVRALRPARVLELGTSLGLSAAYLRIALDLNAQEGATPGHLITIEGDPGLADRAATHLHRMSTGSVQVVTGAFQDVLPGVLEKSSFDLVFIDGHHETQAVLQYVEQIMPFLNPGGWLLLDDLEPWTTSVRHAWKPILRGHPGTTGLDLIKWGIIIRNPEAL